MKRSSTTVNLQKPLTKQGRCECVETTIDGLLCVNSRYQAMRTLYSADASPTIIQLLVDTNTGKEYVQKTTERHKIVSTCQWISARRELELHRSLWHPNLVDYIDGKENEQKVIIILEYLHVNDYFTQRFEVNNNPFCAKRDGGLEKFRSFTFDIVSGLAYLHRQGIVHLDLKPGNLLMSREVGPDEYPLVKLCDLGLSRKVGEDGRALVEKRCGSSFYIAPEVTDQSFVTTSADMWSLGVLLHLFAVGFPPHALRWQPGEELKFSPRYWRKFENSGLQDFIVRCLQLPPEDRLTAVQGLSHPWLQST